MKSIYRVTLQDCDDPTDLDQQMSVDVLVDESQQISRNIAFCGWWGRLNTTDLAPFIVHRDGKVDFGSDENTDQVHRFGTINIHSKRIVLGEYVTYFSKED